MSNIRGGGAPCAVVNWANAWNRRGHDVAILVIHPSEGIGEDYPVDASISVTRLDLMDRPVANKLMAFRQIWLCLYRLRKAILRTRPDVVLCFFEPLNVRVLMACFGLIFPVVVMEQTHLGQISIGEFWEKWRQRVYPRAAAQVNLTEDASRWCEERFKVKIRAVIPNPVLPVVARADLRAGGRKTVVAAGRFVDQKGFDMLVQAFAKIADTNPEWDLVIYGEGENRGALEKAIAEYGLGNRVFLPGWTNALSERMAQADMFVLSSRYEGFGNVVAEALAVGLPVVSFDCKSGPGEIVRHGVDGLLVPPLDVDGLSENMGVLMNDEDLRCRFGAKALEAQERFSVDRTMALWGNLFKKLQLL